MNIGAFAGGIASGASQELSAQENRAFQLKLQSSKIEQEMAAQQQLRQQEITAQSNTAQLNYERSLLPQATADALGQSVGAPGALNGVKEADAANITEQLRLRRFVQQDPVFDKGTGVLSGYRVTNVKDGSSKLYDEPSAKDGILAYRSEMQMLSLWNEEHNLYKLLGGPTGGLSKPLNALPNNLLPARTRLASVAKQLAAMSGHIEAGIPAGRMSGTILDLLANTSGSADVPSGVETDMYKNALLRMYGRLSKMGTPNTNLDDTGQPTQNPNGIVIPSQLANIFAGIQHHRNGTPPELTKYVVRDNHLYDTTDPSNQPIGHELSDGQIPTPFPTSPGAKRQMAAAIQAAQAPKQVGLLSNPALVQSLQAAIQAKNAGGGK